MWLPEVGDGEGRKGGEWKSSVSGRGLSFLSSSYDLGHGNLPLFQSSRFSILLYQQSHYFKKTFLVEAKFIMIMGPLRSKYALIERGDLESYQAEWTPKLCEGGAGS